MPSLELLKPGFRSLSIFGYEKWNYFFKMGEFR
jgi:hypothetical protein